MRKLKTTIRKEFKYTPLTAEKETAMCEAIRYCLDFNDRHMTELLDEKIFKGEGLIIYWFKEGREQFQDYGSKFVVVYYLYW